MGFNKGTISISKIYSLRWNHSRLMTAQNLAALFPSSRVKVCQKNRGITGVMNAYVRVVDAVMQQIMCQVISIFLYAPEHIYSWNGTPWYLPSKRADGKALKQASIWELIN